MPRQPTLAEVQRALRTLPIEHLTGAAITLVSARNHLIYRLEGPRGAFILRMINPESYRRGEWISMQEEWQVLRAIAATGRGPRVYALPKVYLAGVRQAHPALIQEFVEATCFNALKPLTREHLVETARAIAEVNAQEIGPERFPFMAQYVEPGYRRQARARYLRLASAVLLLPRPDVIRWALRILPLVLRTGRILSAAERVLPKTHSFHYDGAHTANTYWRNGRVVFLDWQKVSWRNDPTFTLVRFATSVGPAGDVSPVAWDTLINAYLEVRPIPDFAELARVRLIERQTADLVWVLWDHARGRDPRRVGEVGTSVMQRYQRVRRMLHP